jgi:uncharacterized membrane protein YvlD (DUF360 family)
MVGLVIKLLVRVVVFGIAIAYVTRKNAKVKVEPRAALPAVALVFALLNTGLYWLIAGTFKVVTLWTLAIVAPFVANAALLWLTDRILKPFKVDGWMALAYAAFVVTLAHLFLHVLHLFHLPV